jgi:D-sedoheptulose 7-phosphate isomerase
VPEPGRERVRRAIEAHAALARELLAGDAPEAVAQVAEVIAQAYRGGGKLLLLGNGGSAADAQHLAAELVGRYLKDRRPLAALALADNASSLTAISNDYAFERAFARQVEALGAPGDVVIAISTSGASANVLAALRAARERGLVTVGVTGRRGDALAAACDHCIRVPSDETPRIQEGYMLLCHALCELVEERLFPDH